MKGLENLTDVLAIVIGMFGAFVKGVKQRLKIQTLILSMVIAGILTYGMIGVLEIFYHDLSPRLVILISFVVGWGANEITGKIDLLVDDLYLYLSGKLKNQNKNGGDQSR